MASILRKALINNTNFQVSKKIVSNAVIKNLRLMSSGTSYQNILVEVKGEKNDVGFIKLNRPKALNALCGLLMTELADALRRFDLNDEIGAVVLTGSEKAFAAGADIKEMKDSTFAQCVTGNFLSEWDAVANSSKPLIAAVQGYALGGGCELAMMCDIIYAAENAKFGQPEILLGTIPGAGGTQRLPKMVGKSRAMELVLSGNQITAAEADKWGLVSRVFPTDKVVEEAIKLAQKIASNSQLITILCKKAVLHSYNTTLAEGMVVEKQIFHSTFATEDRKEGMAAFVEKRSPKFTKS